QAQLAVELVDARAQLAGVRAAVFGIGSEQVAHADGQQHAVDRAPRPIALEQAEKAEPGGAVARAIAVMRGVAAGGVDENGFAGEPPVAVARAPDAAQDLLAQLPG